MVRGGRGRVVVGRLASLASVLVRPHRAAAASIHSPTATTSWRTLAPSSPGRAVCVGVPPPAPSLFSLHLGLSRGGGRRAAVHGGGRADRRQPGGAGAGRGDGRADEGAHGVRGGGAVWGRALEEGRAEQGRRKLGTVRRKKAVERGARPSQGLPSPSLFFFFVRARLPSTLAAQARTCCTNAHTHTGLAPPPPLAAPSSSPANLARPAPLPSVFFHHVVLGRRVCVRPARPQRRPGSPGRQGAGLQEDGDDHRGPGVQGVTERRGGCRCAEGDTGGWTARPH